MFCQNIRWFKWLIRCYYLSFWQFRYFLVDGAVSVSKERSFFVALFYLWALTRIQTRSFFLSHHLARERARLKNNSVWWQIFESIYLVKQKAERWWDNNTVYNLFLFYPCCSIGAIFNRLNLRLSEKSWSLGYILK